MSPQHEQKAANFHHTESQRLQLDLEKVQQLEGKITGELSSLKERVSTMEAELQTYRDLDTLRRTAEEKEKVTQDANNPRFPVIQPGCAKGLVSLHLAETKLKITFSLLLQRLQEEKVSLTQRRDAFSQLLEEMNQKYEALKTKLQENETHTQVRLLSS